MQVSNPPIVQLLLTAQFAPAFDNLSMIDVADLYGSFRGDLPVFAQVPRAGPMSFEPFEDGDASSAFIGMPRVRFAKSDASLQVLFQDDRVSVGWNRTSSLFEEADYPGFTEIYNFFGEALDKVLNYAKSKSLPLVNPHVGEIVYTDCFAIEYKDLNRPRPVSSIFNLSNPGLTFPILSFDYSWTERAGLNSGFVSAAASGPALAVGGIPSYQLETTTSFDLGGDWTALREKFESGHGAALSVFDRVVNSDSLAKLKKI